MNKDKIKPENVYINHLKKSYENGDIDKEDYEKYLKMKR